MNPEVFDPMTGDDMKEVHPMPLSYLDKQMMIDLLNHDAPLPASIQQAFERRIGRQLEKVIAHLRAGLVEQQKAAMNASIQATLKTEVDKLNASSQAQWPHPTRAGRETKE